MANSTFGPKTRRVFQSLPDLYVIGLVGALMALIAGIIAQAGAVNWHGFLPYVVVGALLTIILIAIKTRFEYIRNTYDPTLALVYSDKFDAMLRDRSDAAICLEVYKDRLTDVKDLKEELEAIDTVLDWLDDLGFLLEGGQISDKVAHHFFYYHIRGYWRAAEDYIEAWRKERGEEPRWGYIRKLFAETCDVEISNPDNKTATRSSEYARDPKERVRFLKEEIDLKNKGRERLEQERLEAAALKQLEAPPDSIRDQSIRTPSRESHE